MAAHQDIRQGSSVRGAIDLTLVAGQLFNLTAERFVAPQGPATETPASAEAAERAYRELVYDAMVVSLGDVSPSGGAGGALAAGREPTTRSEKSMAFSGSGAPATTDEQAERE